LDYFYSDVCFSGSRGTLDQCNFLEGVRRSGEDGRREEEVGGRRRGEEDQGEGKKREAQFPGIGRGGREEGKVGRSQEECNFLEWVTGGGAEEDWRKRGGRGRKRGGREEGKGREGREGGHGPG
jgi:hypothetical protein